MTSDQVIPFEQITKTAGSNFRSLKNQPQKYDGGSILINSDRVILDAKKTHIMLFSNEEIYLNSFKNTSIDTDSSIILTANVDISLATGRTVEIDADTDFRMNVGKDVFMLAMEKTSVLSNKIFIGSTNNDEEPMVGGASLSKWLARLILALIGNPAAQVSAVPWISQKGMRLPRTATPGTAAVFHTVPFTGALSPEISLALQKLYLELALSNSGQSKPSSFAGAPFNSGDNFVRLANDVVKREKNNFKSGKQIKIENNKWLLKDPYYKVL
jgi:hypothetical protein